MGAGRDAGRGARGVKAPRFQRATLAGVAGQGYLTERVSRGQAKLTGVFVWDPDSDATEVREAFDRAEDRRRADIVQHPVTFRGVIYRQGGKPAEGSATVHVTRLEGVRRRAHLRASDAPAFG